MKILFFSPNSGSPKHGMVFRNYSWAREWVRQGHDVTIVTSSFTHSRSINPDIKGRIDEEMIDGIRYIWVWGNRYNYSNPIMRLLAMAVFTLQCLLLSLPVKKDFDIIISSSPHPFTIYPAKLYAQRCKAKLIYDIRDLWPLTLIKLGKISERNPIVVMMSWAEKFACRHADLVTAVPRNCENYLRTQGLPADKFLPVANGALTDQEELPLPETHRDFMQKLKEKGAFIVGYAGTLGLSNALHILIDAATQTDKKIHIVLMGHGGHMDDLRAQAERLHIADRVHFLPSVTRAQVPSFLRQIDLAYVGLEDTPLYQLGASLTKLNDYMLAAKPTLYAGNDPDNAIEASGAGFICPPADIHTIAELLNRAASMPPSELQALGKKGHDWLLQNNLVSQQVKQILAKLVI
jgi:glycosyltransferase involved in cell wall biosynthesis